MRKSKVHAAARRAPSEKTPLIDGERTLNAER